MVYTVQPPQAMHLLHTCMQDHEQHYTEKQYIDEHRYGLVIILLNTEQVSKSVFEFSHNTYILNDDRPYPRNYFL